MSGLEAIVGLKKMTLNQCQELAKTLGHDSATFDLCGPKGKKPCKWLDAYLGMFIIDGSEGFTMVSQLQFAQDLWCENLQFASPSGDNGENGK